jgi:hypothetical protein
MQDNCPYKSVIHLIYLTVSFVEVTYPFKQKLQ